MVEGAGNGPAEETESKGTEDASKLDALQGEMESLKKEVERQQIAASEYLNLAKRIQADYDNYKKRAQKDREDTIKSANDRLILDLLSVLDDLERALNVQTNDEELRRGVSQIHANLLALLKSYGLREMPLKDKFDPNLHEALAACEGEEGMIQETYQKGYYIGPRVIRHAKVTVGKVKEGESNG